MSETARSFSPGAPCIRFSEQGEPFLQGWRCGACDQVFVAPARACPRCCAPASLQPFLLSHRGRLYNYTIVHRSLPGVPTPFVSAVVELEGGGVLKGNLSGVEPKAEAIAFDMPVEVVFRDSDQIDSEGRNYLVYGFQPRKDAA